MAKLYECNSDTISHCLESIALVAIIDLDLAFAPVAPVVFNNFEQLGTHLETESLFSLIINSFKIFPTALKEEGLHFQSFS